MATKVKDQALANAQALAEIIVDEDTPPQYQIEALNKLLESKANDNFFVTMLEEDLSMGECPSCGHKNHWLIPEEDLNQMGLVTAETDSRVKVHTTADDCEEFQQACVKKKCSV